MKSIVCRYEHFSSEWFTRWSHVMRDVGTSIPHRKMWEWCAIAETLWENGKLKPGMTGLGFAVGTEPLPSVFANLGARIIATDRPEDTVGWGLGGMHSSSVGQLLKPGMVKQPDFDRLVSFKPVDMTDLSQLGSAEYDFLWSSCSLEHLGTLENGMSFLKDCCRLLKKGGVAVHTTEFNCSSNDQTVEAGGGVLYRRRDLEKVAGELRLQRCGMESFDFELGVHRFDIDYDETEGHGEAHIKLLLDGFVATSILLVVHKA